MLSLCFQIEIINFDPNRIWEEEEEVENLLFFAEITDGRKLQAAH